MITKPKQPSITHLRLDLDLKPQVEARAKAEGRTITNFINHVLRKYLGGKNMYQIEKESQVNNQLIMTDGNKRILCTDYHDGRIIGEGGEEFERVLKNIKTDTDGAFISADLVGYKIK